MVFFKQLGLLLRHKILLRRRQLSILTLEIFWPGVVFFAVLLFRLKFTPEAKETCYYNSRALTSAGAVEFIQSLVCNLNNPCLNESSHQEIPTFPNARIHKLVNNLSPLLTDKRVTNAIEDLPKGIALLTSIVNALSNEKVKDLLENGLPIYQIVHDKEHQRVKLFLDDALSAKGDHSLESTEILVNSSINIVKLSQFSKRTSSDSIHSIICNSSLLSNIFIIQDQHYLEKASEFLCSLNQTQTSYLLQIAQDSLDFVKIIERLSMILDQIGLKTTRHHLENVSKMIKEIDRTQIFDSVNSLLNKTWTSDVTNLISPTDFYKMEYHLNTKKSGSVGTLVDLTRNETLIGLIDQISEIIMKLSLAEGGGDEQIIETFMSILTGLQSLKYLSDKGLFQIKYQFRDLIRNVEKVKTVLESRLGYDINTIEAILHSKIDFTNYVAEESIDPYLLCNSTQLLHVLEIPKSKTTGEDMVPFDLTYHSLCTLYLVQKFNFTNEMLKHLAVRKIISNFVQHIADGVLVQAELAKEDVPVALNGLKAAGKAMPLIKNFVNNFTAALDVQEELAQLNSKKGNIDLFDSSYAANIIGKSLCGHPLPIINSEIKHLRPMQHKSQINQDELESFNSEFCRNGYRQIMKLSGGPIIWAWLKPILAGKVLYSPDNHLTREIMKRMNGTFAFMSVFIHVLESWSQTISSLDNFYADPNATLRMKTVQHLVMDILGKDVAGLFHTIEKSKIGENIAHSAGLLDLVQFVGNLAQCFELRRFIGYKNEISLEETARKLTKSHELLAGVIFLNLNDQPTLPPNVEYKIRVDIDFVPTTKMLKDRIWEPGPRDHYAKHLGYLRGFVQVQEMIDRAITKIHLNQSNLSFSPEVHLQQFPYACYINDKFGFFILALMPVISTVAWIFLIAFLIRDFVLERELHLEEFLRVAGLKPSVAWVAWFVIGFSVMAFGTICGLTIFKIANLIQHSDMIILYLYFISFSFSIIMYCYLISSFFKAATIASLTGIVAYLASYLPFMVAITLEHEMSFLQKLSTCLSMSTSLCFGIMYLARYESQGIGIQWSNIWQSPMSEDTMSFAHSGIMMFTDGCIYFLIAWYISNVFPAGFKGYSEPWYFFLLKRYWGFKKRKDGDIMSHNLRAHIHSNEGPNKNSLHNGWQRRPGMSLHNLYVIYNKGKSSGENRAVSNLNLELKEGQITTLLGRNGAGKTTTINVLTGQMLPTSGSVYIYDHPVPEEFSEARKLLGYCPQYNVLFENLTVREHLRFFSDLKGLLPNDQIDEDIDLMLQSTGLWNLQHELTKNLSGGLQRRLCVALAFVGGSKLIILDEPTSSVDPVARRSIWDLIVHQKQSRTVLLTTHHMDEADVLSDQVAVIHRGKLLCSGSPLLLKSKYGFGYQLTVSKQSIITEDKKLNDGDSGRASNEPPTGSECEQSDSERLLAFIKCLIPNASLLEDHNNSEVILALPHQAPDGSQHDYATFFRCLDANIHTLGFGSYGLTSTTLEQVFLTLCNLEESNIPLMESTKLALMRILSSPIRSDHTDPDLRTHLNRTFNSYELTATPLVNGFLFKWMQFWTLLSKRTLHALRDYRSFFCNFFLPCMFIGIAMGLTCIKPTFAPDPILPLSPSIFGPSTTSFYYLSDTNNNSNFVSIVEQLTREDLKQNLYCPKPRTGWKVAKCPIVRSETNLPKHLRNNLKSKDEKCYCTKSCYRKKNIYYNISSIRLTSNGYIYDLSAEKSLNDFLLNTFTSFNDHRYGGYSFHQRIFNSSAKKDIVKVWFDNNGYHSISSYLSALNNAIMRTNLENAGLNSSLYSITTYSHPFHVRSAQLGDQSLMQRAADAGIALIILVGFVFIPTSFVFYIVRERTQEEKQLQKIFGVGTFLYWFSAIVWDMISILMAVFLSGAILYVFQIPIYTARLNLPAVMLLLLLFGWAMTSLVYLMEKIFQESSIAFMVIYCLSLFVGMNTMVMRLLIDVFQLLEVSPAFKATFQNAALIFPPYALMSGLVDITRNQLFAEIFTLFQQDAYINPFSMDMLGPHYISLSIEGLILFLVNLIVEFIMNCSFGNCRGKSLPIAQYSHEDCDVAEERKRVTQAENSLFDVLRVVSVSKVFKSMFGKRLAVNNISFGVPRGECFGLLGVNGAGKTTLFKILTGQMKPSSGENFINDKIGNGIGSPLIGYCPQADALDVVLTPKQHLEIYAAMRGVRKIDRARIVSESLSKFQLTTHCDMPVKVLSRGTKRKLCLAIAMLGNPSIVLLDEPTSGMDPMSRRCLWVNIQNAIRDRRSVLLTSHSMEECDILCSRLAIMVNGSFRCIGSPQYLKHKFGSGYTITLRLNEYLKNWTEASKYMKQNFPAIILRAHHHNMLEFSLPTNDVQLSTIFDCLQNGSRLLNLLDYSVSQTSLDQVFVSFANQQDNDYHTNNKDNSKVANFYSNSGFMSSNLNLKQDLDKCNPYIKTKNAVTWSTIENTITTKF